MLYNLMEPNQMQNYFTGTSGLLLPVPNKTFYPKEFQEKSRLNYYSSLVNSIEINSSFYKIPRNITVEKWTREVPRHFAFSYKLFKGVTHARDLNYNTQDLHEFIQQIDSVKEHRACLLVQFPPSIRITHFRQIDHLISEIKSLDASGKWKIAIEFRHESLYIPEVYELLESHQVALVLHDKTSSISPFIESDTNFKYLRFHGPNGNYRGSYDEGFLSEYATYISEWLSEGKRVYSYFNNTMGNAFQNLAYLRQSIVDKLK